MRLSDQVITGCIIYINAYSSSESVFITFPFIHIRKADNLLIKSYRLHCPPVPRPQHSIFIFIMKVLSVLLISAALTTAVRWGVRPADRWSVRPADRWGVRCNGCFGSDDRITKENCDYRRGEMVYCGRDKDNYCNSTPDDQWKHWCYGHSHDCTGIDECR